MVVNDRFHCTAVLPVHVSDSLWIITYLECFSPNISGSPDDGTGHSLARRAHYSGSDGGGGGVDMNIGGGGGGGGGMVPQYGDMDEDIGVGVNMPSSIGSSNVLAKPVPTRRLSEKTVAQARASLGNTSTMAMGSYGNNSLDMSGLSALDPTFGTFLHSFISSFEDIYTLFSSARSHFLG